MTPLCELPHIRWNRLHGTIVAVRRRQGRREMPTNAERLDAIEKFLERLRIVAGLAGFTGFTAAALLAYAFYGYLNIQSKIKSTGDDIAAIENRVVNVDKTIDQKVSEKINREVLASSYSNRGVLAQIQAQAICASMMVEPLSVQAIYREPIGYRKVENQDRKLAYSSICPEVCSKFTSIPYERKLKSIGAVHIYEGSKPFTVTESDKVKFRKGLAAYLYTADNKNDLYGPNYCCCADDLSESKPE